MGYEPVSDRIITIKIKASPINFNVIQVYAPTSTATFEAIEKFFSGLEFTMMKIINSSNRCRELLVILGDLNAMF